MEFKLSLRWLNPYRLSSQSIGVIFLFVLGFLSVISCQVNSEELLGMKRLYDKGRPAANRIEQSDTSSDARYEGVEPYTGPHFGWRTQGEPAINPTKVAADGLDYVINGQMKAAKAHAYWLIDHATYQHDTMFFPFSFDYAPFWPYDLKALGILHLLKALP